MKEKCEAKEVREDRTGGSEVDKTPGKATEERHTFRLHTVPTGSERERERNT